MTPPTASGGPHGSIAGSIGDRRVAIDYLISILRVRGRPGSPPALTAVQWHTLADEALRYRLGPLLLAHTANGPHAQAMPAEVRERLRDVHIRNGFRNGILAREVAAAARALGGRGIPTMLLKGQHLANFEYSQPALRSMADIDIMVPRDRLAEAESVFVELGYGPHPRPDIEAHCAWSNQLAKLEKAGAEVVELHYAIERPTSPFTIETAGLWARAVESKLAGQSVWRLSTEDLILHLSLHLAYHHQFDRAALKGIADIAVVVDRHETSIDWPALVRRADDWGATSFVHCSLELARRMLGAPVPAGIAAPTSEEEAILDTIEQFVRAPAIELPETVDEQLRGVGGGGWLSRLARSVFLPPGQLRELYGEQGGSRRIWSLYAIRIADVVRRRGSLMARLLMRTRDVQPTLDRRRDRDIIRDWVERQAPAHGGSQEGTEAGD